MSKNIYIQAITDWRFYVLTVLSIAGMVLTISGADSLLTFLMSKVAGGATLLVTMCLGAYWYDQGKMKWIDKLADEEE